MADEGKQSNGDTWGDDISEERKAELEARLQAWASEADHGEKLGPFDRRGEYLHLTGADVFWLAARMLAGIVEDKAIVMQVDTLRRAQTDSLLRLSLDQSELNLQESRLYGAHLEGAVLILAHLEGADLTNVHLEMADLGEAHLERALLGGAHLEGADMSTVRLEGVNLFRAHLEGADLSGAHLEGADLREAHLEGTNLSGAHLEARQFANNDQDLARTRTGKQDFPGVLPPADLRLTLFDRATRLERATLGNDDWGFVWAADTRWGEVNLAVLNWGDTPILQDERAAKEWQPSQSKETSKQRQRAERLDLYRAATRANRQLATVLRAQGLNDDADKFAYRAQVLQRTVLRLQGRRAASAFSWLLDLISGYGYEPIRSVIAYVVIILFFAGLYLLNSQFAAPHLRWDEALVLSISSFHGRGFFTSGISLGDNLARLAAGEAVVGLLIEITFIATFTQRFFAR